MKNKKIVITGGSGFIGTHLIKKLLIKGNYDITVIDIFPPRVEGVSFVQSDISDLEKIKPYLIGIDTVVHLAAKIGVDNCRNNPEMVVKVNYRDTVKFIDLCIDTKVRRFLFSSSSEIYGNSTDIPFEEDRVPEPISVYAQNKLKVENYLKSISSKMSVGIVRFFNVYGPWQKNSFVVSIFIEAALNNRDIKILGDGKQSRCFTYVEDAVEGVITLMEYDKTPFEIVNIGNSQEVSINELTETILKNIPNSKSKIVFQEYGNTNSSDVRDSGLEITRRVPLTSKANNLLGFLAKTDLNLGILFTIKHYEQAIQHHE